MKLVIRDDLGFYWNGTCFSCLVFAKIYKGINSLPDQIGYTYREGGDTYYCRGHGLHERMAWAEKKP